MELLLLRNAEKYPLAVLVSEFLNAQASYKAVNQDQWVNILDFCSQIEPDLSNYDETSSCTGAPHHHHTPHAHMHTTRPRRATGFLLTCAGPVLLDEYVEWLREKDPEKYPLPTRAGDTLGYC